MSATNGYAQAVARYGDPVERVVRLNVSLDSIHYWELVTKRRSAEVVMALRRPDGRFVVHTKSFYPEGAYRLMTGGVKPAEDLVAAAQREAWEETGEQVTIERFLAVVESSFCRNGREIPFTSYVFLMSDDGGPLQAADTEEDISDYQFVTLDEMSAVADQLESLDENWIDWGRFRAAPHRLLVELLSGDDL